MVLTLSFAKAQVTLTPSATAASTNGADFAITSVRHFPDGHIEAEARNFSGKIILSAEESPVSATPTLTLSFAGAQVTLTPSATAASNNGADFAITGVRHFPDGQVRNFCGKVVLAAEVSSVSATPTANEEVEGEREPSTDQNAELNARQSKKNPEKSYIDKVVASLGSRQRSQFFEKLEELRAT
ncbi:hypothetical protein ACHAWF_009643 [Thalassiosira exigua]